MIASFKHQLAVCRLEKNLGKGMVIQKIVGMFKSLQSEFDEEYNMYYGDQEFDDSEDDSSEEEWSEVEEEGDDDE